jgi:hypothetical protein
MKNINNKRIPQIVAFLLCMGAAGCASLLPPSKYVEKPKGEGYGIVARTYHRDMLHTYNDVEVDYWDKEGKRTLIWPTLADRLVQIGTDGAMFHGHLINGPSHPYAGQRGPIRFFAVRQKGPVVDITDDIVYLWTKASGTNFSEAIRNGRQRIGNVEQRGEFFRIHIGIMGDGGGTLEITKDQLFDLIREAKEKGKPMKDPGTGTPYLKRDLEAELSK